MEQFSLLEKIHNPADVKKLDASELTTLCEQIRQKIILTVSETGGHLSSNLGVVELTVALHRSFSSPQDQIVFDVGHQCYTHKLLTGRFDSFDSLRQKGGISGFTNPDESDYDIFFSGHSSTSVSAACGLAKAKKIRGEKGYVIAVIGDGSMTGGEAYEGLNNAGADADNLIIIINDNKMSIARNKGPVATALGRIRSTKRYYSSKMKFEKFLGKIPLIGRPLRRRLVKYKYALKGVLYHSSFFDDLGYAYLGPVDGHDIAKLENIFEVAKSRGRPCVIHVDTIKGKGYTPAETDAERFHGIGKFDIESGESAPSGKSFSTAFGDVICNFAAKDKRICAITAAMPSGTGLECFAQEYPDRFFDVGIAEQHAVSFAAGLAKNGLIPVFAVYSTFLQRAYDQIIEDVCLQKLKVIFAIDRAGLVGNDGQTHQGVYDVVMLQSIPDIAVFAPCCYAELDNHMYRAVYKEENAVAVRYPRGSEGYLPEGYTPDGKDFTVFEASSPTDKLIVTYGITSCEAFKAQLSLERDGVPVTILKLNKIKPIHPEAVGFAKNFSNIYFYEESMKSGGTGEHFLALLAKAGFSGKFLHRAVDNCFVLPAKVSEQLSEFSLDAKGMSRDIKGE